MGKKLNDLARRAEEALERRLQGVRFELKALTIHGPGLPFTTNKFEGVVFRTGGPATHVTVTATYQTTPRWALLRRLEHVPTGVTAEIDNGGLLGMRGSVTLSGPQMDRLGQQMHRIKVDPADCWSRTARVRSYLANNLRA